LNDDTLTEVRDLLTEIRDLLVPVAGAHREGYEKQVARDRQIDEIREVLSSDKRQAAWRLADGSRTQRQIAQQAGLDEGNASRLFKRLRELQALSDAPNPMRALEVRL
jgi:hypothetical protein